jgi:hypothetical protein
VDTSCFGRRCFGLEAAGSEFADEADRDLRGDFDIHGASPEWLEMESRFRPYLIDPEGCSQIFAG